MTDTLTKKQRSEAMSKIRSRDTKPEWILRCGLHRLGFRYRIKNSQLPGQPDLIFPKFRAAVFVHGCYWHRHPGCKDASIPKTNVNFWTRKFAENVERDRRMKQKLENRGWRIMVVWECELSRQTVETIQRVAYWLRQGVGCHDYAVNRNELLAVAEEKIRYRIASYNEKTELSGFGAIEVKQRCKQDDLP
jgi:DNA mismatch endonuclease (patch repair protein)